MILAFTCHTVVTAAAVVASAETAQRPNVLLLGSGSYNIRVDAPLLLPLFEPRARASIPVFVELDHARDPLAIAAVVGAGVDAVTADAAHLSDAENASFVRRVVSFARSRRWLSRLHWATGGE
jgi:tagatose 1,6-diphosphate aldolase GatY/KbaY